jgi:hypothetical protein
LFSSGSWCCNMSFSLDGTVLNVCLCNQLLELSMSLKDIVVILDVRINIVETVWTVCHPFVQTSAFLICLCNQLLEPMSL